MVQAEVNMFVEIRIGEYIIQPHPVPDGRVFVEIQRIDAADSHDHPVGPEKTIDLDQLFKDEPKWS